jgi:peptidoglycan/xylan/chitin deacetylase (PgdA/CDA1 family)
MRNLIKTIWLAVCWLLSGTVFKKESPVLAVLMYHSIEESDWKYGIYPDDFARQVKYLLKRYNFFNLSDVYNFISGSRSLSTSSVCLTFDDGYRGLYDYVFPIIKDNNIPITVFLTTNLMPSPKLGNLDRLDLWQIKEMRESGLVSFEVHGHNHLNLDEIKSAKIDLDKEIGQSHQWLKDNLNYDSRYFAYASGRKSNEVVSYLKANKYLAACTITEGFVSRGDDPFLIKRIQVDRTINFLLFILRLTPALNLNRKIVDNLRKIWKK